MKSAPWIMEENKDSQQVVVQSRLFAAWCGGDGSPCRLRQIFIALLVALLVAFAVFEHRRFAWSTYGVVSLKDMMEESGNEGGGGGNLRREGNGTLMEKNGASNISKGNYYQDILHGQMGAEEEKIWNMGSDPCSMKHGEDGMNICYWRHYPDDFDFISPYYRIREHRERRRYITFQWDIGAFNNMRLAFETVAATSLALGRTLVLPPERHWYQQKEAHGILDYYDVKALKERFDIMTMEEFLTIAETGEFGEKPPSNLKGSDLQGVYAYLGRIGYMPHWQPDSQILVVPQIAQDNGVEKLSSTKNEEINHYVNGENRAIIRYTKGLDAHQVLWFPVVNSFTQGDSGKGRNERWLVSFYTFVVSEYEPYDSLFKRAVRDNIRFNENILSQASRIVRRLHEIAGPGKGGNYIALHVRRGDFERQYKMAIQSCEQIFQNVRELIDKDTVIYIATDEKDHSYFQPFLDHYKTFFLTDFPEVMGSISPDFYGMVEQLICANAGIFGGTWWSTFTGYITRLRGYYGHDVSTTYFLLKDFKYVFHRLNPPNRPYWVREFLNGWTGIETRMTQEDHKIFAKLRKYMEAYELPTTPISTPMPQQMPP